jgi:PPM family protein phosphatase
MVIPKTFVGSDRGIIRSENEDSYLLYIPGEKTVLDQKGLLAVVADGVGGGPAGKRASALAIDAVKCSYYGNAASDNAACLAMSFQGANTKIIEESQISTLLYGMATTCVAFVCRKDKAHVCNIGDSRAYLLRDSVLQQLTRDHSLVNEMIREGTITPEEGFRHPQRNVILEALGFSKKVRPDLITFEVRKGDTILLSSDGLHGYSSDWEICSILSSCTVEEAGPRLIEFALNKGGQDNVTVVLLGF